MSFALTAGLTASLNPRSFRCVELAYYNEIITINGHPLFSTIDEFDRWMADLDALLTLKPNW